MRLDRPIKCVCGAKGEAVILVVGNVPLRFHYRDALWVSAEMRRLAAVIKRAVFPDTNIQMKRSAGILHDASAKLKPLPRHHNGVAIHVKHRELLAKDLKVFTQGLKVMVQVGRDVVGIVWTDAFIFAQDIRLWAKKAMRNAGDDRHWSRVPSPLIEAVG